MPSVLIETRRQHGPDREQAMMSAVHAALVSAFKIPENDRDVRLIAHEPHRFACPSNKAAPDLFTVVNIDAFSGRSLDAKRALYRAIVENLEPVGIPKDHVKILIREIPPSDWGLRGGQAACDIDLGFKIDV
jgi:phenylpyruvate tautomerase PptA (4-oxalocrotonate tautomerase family)